MAVTTATLVAQHYAAEVYADMVARYADDPAEISAAERVVAAHPLPEEQAVPARCQEWVTVADPTDPGDVSREGCTSEAWRYADGSQWCQAGHVR